MTSICNVSPTRHIRFEISASLVPSNQLNYNKHTDLKLSVGITNGKAEDWSPDLISRGQENEITTTSYPWLPQV